MAKEDAYNTGKKVARKWINHASRREIIDVLPRSNLHHDRNYFALMRNNLFISIEKTFQYETKRFKWFINVVFMRGWRDEVIFVWNNFGNYIINCFLIFLFIYVNLIRCLIG